MIKITSTHNNIDSGSVVMIVLFIMALAGSSVESSQHLIDGVNSLFCGVMLIEVPATIDVPIIAEWIGLIWIIVLIMGGYVQKFKSLSPQIFANGLKHSMPFRGAASINTEGHLMYVRGNGSAAPFIPTDGNTIVCAPSSHCFNAGEHLIIEADIEHKGPVSGIPFEIKSNTFADRDGLDKISECSIGWISKTEIENNKAFRTVGDQPEVKDLKPFLLGMNDKNESIDRLFELRRYRISAMKNDISLINRLTKEGFEHKKNTIYDKVWGQFE